MPKTSSSNFAALVEKRSKDTASSVLVGFDPVLEQIPQCYLKVPSKDTDTFVETALTRFYCDVLDTIKKDAIAVKPNSAFYEQYGIGGMKALQNILLYAQKVKVLTVLDSKRGDIGSTAKAYASAALSQISFQGKKITAFPSDAVTVNPLLGFETIEPFLELAIQNSKGIFVLLKTSNPGSADLQDQRLVSGSTVSDKILDWVKQKDAYLQSKKAGTTSLGVVIGATHPDILAAYRAALPSTLFLVPGVGAQGGTPADVVPAYTSFNHGALINSSRGIFSFEKSDSTTSKCMDRILSNTRALKDGLNSAQQNPRALKQKAIKAADIFQAETHLLEAFQLLGNGKILKNVKNKVVGDFWDSSWIRAPFEECLTFGQLVAIGYENLTKKRSMNGEKMMALANAMKRASLK